MAEQSTIAVYPLDGTNRKFVVPYEYLARRFVTVTLLGTDRKPLILGTDFRFISANQIETTQAWGDTQGYANIEVRRETSATQRLVDFYDGSVLRSRDLNVSAIQTIHIAEEARNMAGETLAENLEGNLDARFRKMVNLGVGTDDFDAVTVGQMKTWSASALNQADRAEVQADRAEVQAITSAASKNGAAASQSAAKTSETNAKTSETNAKTSENAAATERALTETARNVTTAARDTILAIELTANAANTSAIAAKNAAAASQSAAKTSETNAKTSETNAKTSETNAKTSETNSAASRDRAEAAKTAIESTVITSLANAQSALASKNAAKISETNAKNSETAALQYRNEASNFIPANHLVKSSNLADIPNKSLARENLDALGVGEVGTGFHTIATMDCNAVIDAYAWSGQSPVILTKSSPNAPPTDHSGHVTHYVAESGNIVQHWHSISAAVGTFVRERRGGVWSPWARFLLSSDKRVAILDFGTMGLHQRKFLPNPFGNDQAVFCTARAEILVGGVWHITGFFWASGGYGTTAHAVAGGIVVQTGNIAVASEYSYSSGGTYNGAKLTSAPVRAIVHHIGGVLI